MYGTGSRKIYERKEIGDRRCLPLNVNEKRKWVT